MLAEGFSESQATTMAAEDASNPYPITMTDFYRMSKSGPAQTYQVHYDYLIKSGMSKEKAGELVGPTKCFVAGTKVATHNLTKNIELIKVGDRVLTFSKLSDSNITLSDWRKLILYAEVFNGVFVDKIYVETLVPVTFIENKIKVGSVISPIDDLLKMGYSNSLKLEVLAINKCPNIQEGIGRVVLTTTQKFSNQLIKLKFVNNGNTEEVYSTPLHRFYSKNRGWISISQGGSYEEFETLNGVVFMESSEILNKKDKVYNIVPEAEFEFYIGKKKLRVNSFLNMPNE